MGGGCRGLGVAWTAVVALVGGGWAAPAAAQGPVKIGASISLTGPYSKPAKYLQEGYLLWQKQVNQRGGLLGRPVTMVLYDDKSEPATSVKIYERLITEDKVDLVLGPYSSPVTNAAAVVTEKYRMPMVAPLAATTSIWERGFRYLFMVISPAEVYLEGVLDIAAQRGLKTVAIINEDSLFSKAAATGAAKIAEEKGLKVIFRDAYPKGSSDFSALLSKVKAVNPDVLLGGTYFDDAVAITRQMKELDLNPKMYGVTVGGDLPEFYQVLGTTAEYVYGSTQWEPSLPFPGINEFVEAYKKMWGRDPSYHSAAGYSGALLLEKAIREVGSLDRDKIRSALLKMKASTIFGDYQVDERGFQIGHKMVIVQWREGKKVGAWPKVRAEQQSPLPTPVLVLPPAPSLPTATPPAKVAEGLGSTPRPPSPDITITFSYPAEGARVAEEGILVVGVVSAAQGIDRLDLMINGRSVPLSRDVRVQPTNAQSQAFTAQVSLRPGPNVIALTAVDRTGRGAQSVRTVYRETVQGAEGASASAGGGAGVRWAVIIGINKYKDPSILPLRYATADAEAVYRFFTTKGKVKPGNTHLLLDQQATQRNIRQVLGDTLRQKALKDDEVIIYYAGHGTTEPDPSVEGGLAKYLVPWDADNANLFSTAIPMDEIERVFGRLATRKILMIQDTCFSGGSGGRTFLAKGLTRRAGSLTDKFLQELTQKEGRMILTASDVNQVSNEDPQLRHGIFTHYFLEGLKGAADLDGDGAVTVREIHLFLQRKVHEHSGGAQTPQLYAIGDMVLVHK